MRGDRVAREMAETVTALEIRNLEIADETFVFVVRADPQPKVAAIFKSCQRAKTRTGANRTEIGFDFLEAE